MHVQQDVFAVVHVGGTQYKITINDTIVTQKLEADLGAEVCALLSRGCP